MNDRQPRRSSCNKLGGYVLTLAKGCVAGFTSFNFGARTFYSLLGAANSIGNLISTPTTYANSTSISYNVTTLDSSCDYLPSTNATSSIASASEGSYKFIILTVCFVFALGTFFATLLPRKNRVDRMVDDTVDFFVTKCEKKPNPQLKVPLITEAIAEQKEQKEEIFQPGSARKFFAYALEGIFDLSSFGMMVTTLTLQYGSLSVVSDMLGIPTWLARYMIPTFLSSFAINYMAFNLKDNAFKNAARVRRYILENKNDVNKCKLAIATLIFFPGVLSAFFNSFFSTEDGLDKLMHLGKPPLWVEDSSWFAAFNATISSGIMTFPSIYDKLVKGFQTSVEIPEAKSPCLSSCTKGRIENPYSILKPALIASSTMDVTGSSALAFLGTMKTIPKLHCTFNNFPVINKRSPGMISVASLNAASAFVTFFCFNTLNGNAIYFDSLKKELAKSQQTLEEKSTSENHGSVEEKKIDVITTQDPPINKDGYISLNGKADPEDQSTSFKDTSKLVDPEGTKEPIEFSGKPLYTSNQQRVSNHPSSLFSGNNALNITIEPEQQQPSNQSLSPSNS